MKSFLVAAGLCLAITPAWSACSVSERPGTPTYIRFTNTQKLENRHYKAACRGWGLTVAWGNPGWHRGELLYYDLGIDNGQGKVVIPLHPGSGSVDQSESEANWSGWLKGRGKTFCFSVKARTEAGPKGCVSLVSTDPICITTPNPTIRRVGRRQPPEDPSQCPTGFNIPAFRN
jgi:hypothetical protein